MSQSSVQDSISILTKRLLVVLERTARLGSKGFPPNLDAFNRLLVLCAENREELAPAMSRAIKALAGESYQILLPFIDAYYVISQDGSEERAEAVESLKAELSGEYAYGRFGAAKIIIDRRIASLKGEAEAVVLAIAQDPKEPPHKTAFAYAIRIKLLPPLTPEELLARIQNKEREFLSESFEQLVFVQESDWNQFVEEQFFLVVGTVPTHQALKLFKARKFADASAKVSAAHRIFVNAKYQSQLEDICRLCGTDDALLEELVKRSTDPFYLHDSAGRFYRACLSHVETDKLIPHVPRMLRFMIRSGFSELVDHSNDLVSLLGGQDQPEMMLEAVLEFFDGNSWPGEGCLYDILDQLLTPMKADKASETN